MIDGLEINHITQERLGLLDGSVILESFLSEFKIAVPEYLRNYLSLAVENDRLETIFPSKLIKAMQ